MYIFSAGAGCQTHPSYVWRCISDLVSNWTNLGGCKYILCIYLGGCGIYTVRICIPAFSATTNRTEIYVYISVLLVVAEYAGFKMFVCLKALAGRSQIDRNAHTGRGRKGFGLWPYTMVLVCDLIQCILFFICIWRKTGFLWWPYKVLTSL